jgi:pimeloyl-ACP methyl ester carboxylesterase
VPHIAADLHTLLDRAHIPGPYVLAGHSFGGLYMLSFAAQFPDQAPAWSCSTPPPKPAPALPTNTESYNYLGRVITHRVTDATVMLQRFSRLGAGDGDAEHHAAQHDDALVFMSKRSRS